MKITIFYKRIFQALCYNVYDNAKIIVNFIGL